MSENILIGLSFLFGILCIRHLRTFDVHEQEPMMKMAAVTAWGGIVSIGLSLFLYGVLQSQGVHVREGFPFSFLYIGFVEEGAKLAALFLCWPFICKEMDEPTDGLIYMACTALGFSLIENFFYAKANPFVSPLIAIRLIICTPMHIAFSIFMGLAFFRAVRFKGGWGGLFGAYFFASIYHTLYDIFVSFWFLLPGLYLILKSAYRWMYRLLGHTAATSPFRQSLAEFVNTRDATTEPGLECLDCGNSAPKPTCSHGKIRIQHCEACGAYLCTTRSVEQILHRFGSVFGDLRKLERPLSRHSKNMRVLGEGNRFDRKKKVACFQLDEFNVALERMTQAAAVKPVFGKR